VETRLQHDGLTAIEWQVVGLLAQSLTVEEVASRLGYEVEAVQIRRAGALAKLARSRRYEAEELRRALEQQPGAP
jgi:DNA-binding NarL/FixJ family response regulator